jgi:hypothetical protein
MIKKTAKDGDYRYVWKFIWFPTHFSNGCWVWLQRVYLRQVYFSERVYVRGWCNVCLSNPEDGLPMVV